MKRTVKSFGAAGTLPGLKFMVKKLGVIFGFVLLPLLSCLVPDKIALHTAPTRENLAHAQFYIIASPDIPVKNLHPHYAQPEDAPSQ